VFFSHNFGSRYARKSNKGSKDSDDSLDSQTILIQKIGSLGWRPGPEEIRRKGKNAPTCDVLHKCHQTAKEKKIFSISTRLVESVEGLNSCRAHSAGELWIVMELKSLVEKVAAMVVKGFLTASSSCENKSKSFQRNVTVIFNQILAFLSGIFTRMNDLS